MITRETAVYRGSSLSEPTAGIGYLPVMESANLGSFAVRVDASVGSDTVFVVKKNGVEISEVTITTGTKIATAAGILADVVFGDVLTVDLESGSAQSPIVMTAYYNDGIDYFDGQDFNFKGDVALDTNYIGNDVVRQDGKVYICRSTQDGVVFYDTVIPDLATQTDDWELMCTYGGGASLPAGDLNAATNKVEKVQGTGFEALPTIVYLADNFDGASLDLSKWYVVAPGNGTYTQSGGNLIFSANGTNALQTLTPFNAIGKTFTIELEQPANGGSSNIFSLLNGGGWGFGFLIAAHNSDPLLYFHVATGLGNSIPYDSVSMRWLRMRHDAATNIGYWETSPTGANGSWTVQKNITDFTSTYAFLSNTSLRLQLNAGSPNNTQIWDNFSSDVILTGGATKNSAYLFDDITGTFKIKQSVEIVAVPANSSSPGSPGQEAFDANYFYKCVATNSWKRIALSSF